MEIGHLNSKNWLFSGKIDLFALFLPIWMLWVFFFVNADRLEGQDLPLWAWVVFILGFDVSHVWSSLFRTYLDKEEFKAHKVKLILTPILSFTISLLLLSYSMGLFWRIMAYLAVFHFIKQQYGFVALYKAKNSEFRTQFLNDKWVVYIATIYPVIFWHFNSKSNFNWFANNDFVALHTWLGDNTVLFSVLNYFYWGIIFLWLFQEVLAVQRKEAVSLGKTLWILTTAVNWWFGIVYYNSDIIFSVSNVVAHGLPYVVLMYYYGVRKTEIVQQTQLSFWKRFRWLWILVLTILCAALVEEYFWDMLVNRTHQPFFERIHLYKWEALRSPYTLAFAVALLALPQQVHYISDGFIWKANVKNKYIKPIFTAHES